jgi:hypothetical protein
LCFASREGKLVVIDAGPAWQVAAIVDLLERIEATPALGGDGSLFVRTEAALCRFE